MAGEERDFNIEYDYIKENPRTSQASRDHRTPDYIYIQLIRPFSSHLHNANIEFNFSTQHELQVRERGRVFMRNARLARESHWRIKGISGQKIPDDPETGGRIKRKLERRKHMLQALVERALSANSTAEKATLEINDYPQKARWAVINRTNIAKELEATGTSITTKGTFYPPGKVPTVDAASQHRYSSQYILFSPPPPWLGFLVLHHPAIGMTAM